MWSGCGCLPGAWGRCSGKVGRERERVRGREGVRGNLIGLFRIKDVHAGANSFILNYPIKLTSFLLEFLHSK